MSATEVATVLLLAAVVLGVVAVARRSRTIALVAALVLILFVLYGALLVAVVSRMGEASPDKRGKLLFSLWQRCGARFRGEREMAAGHRKLAWGSDAVGTL